MSEKNRLVKINGVEYTQEKVKEMTKTEIGELLVTGTNAIVSLFRKRMKFVAHHKQTEKDFYKNLEKIDFGISVLSYNMLWIQKQHFKKEKSNIKDCHKFRFRFQKAAEELLEPKLYEKIVKKAEEV